MNMQNVDGNMYEGDPRTNQGNVDQDREFVINSLTHLLERERIREARENETASYTRTNKSSAQPTPPTVTTVIEDGYHARPRARYPDVEYFTGEDVKAFPPFKINLRTKFTFDSACFLSDREKVLYAYSRLQGRASQRMLP